MMHLVETKWIYQHGAPKSFSADPGFCKPFFEIFLESHDEQLKERPSCSSSKNFVVERNDGTFKKKYSTESREALQMQTMQRL